MDIAFYDADLEYIDYIKKFETAERGFTRVPNVSYHSGNNKFFYGAVLSVNGVNYFVPVSHAIHNKQDDLPIIIKDKKKPIAGTLRFAYMIPIPKEMITILRRDAMPDASRRETVRKELAFCRRKIDKIQKMAASAYERITNNVSASLSHQSCDFKILEVGYLKFCHERDIKLPSDTIKNVLLRNGFNSSRATLFNFFPESELQFAAITSEQAELFSQQNDLLHAIRQGKQSPILQYHKSDAAAVQARLELIASRGTALK